MTQSQEKTETAFQDESHSEGLGSKCCKLEQEEQASGTHGFKVKLDSLNTYGSGAKELASFVNKHLKRRFKLHLNHETVHGCHGSK